MKMKIKYRIQYLRLQFANTVFDIIFHKVIKFLNQFLLLLGHVFLAKSAFLLSKFDRCECPDLLKTECGNQLECKWTGAACEDKVCGDYITEDKCIGQCGWRGNKCVDGKKTCKDMPTEESCFNMANCGWKNNTCSYFTQCKEYQVTKAERCNVIVGLLGERCQPKNTTVVATGRLAKHLVTTSQTFQCEDKVYVDCFKFTTQATCKGDASAKSKCQWKNDGKCYAFKFNYCVDAQGFANTLCDPLYCKQSGSSCLNKACEDITTQTLCTSVPLISNNFVMLCQWSNNKCIRASDASFLTASTCNSGTFGTFHWVTNTNTTNTTTPANVTDAGICKQCIGQILEIILIVLAYAIL